MPVLSQILKKVTCLSVSDKQKDFVLAEAVDIQNKTLSYLTRRAKFTAFGEHYRFQEMISKGNLEEQFKQTVPIHTYGDMYVRWWYRLLNGESYVTWPGKQKYFLTKGFADPDEKKSIPVSRSIINSYCAVGKKYLAGFSEVDQPESDSADLELDFSKTYYGGTLAGIIAHHKPVKYHCCFRTLFIPGVVGKQKHFFITEVGWIGIQKKESTEVFKLLVNNNLYYEFIPFSTKVLVKGALKNQVTLALNQIENDTEYIVVLSNNSGVWRYFTCHTIRFTDKENLLFTITRKVKIGK